MFKNSNLPTNYELKDEFLVPFDSYFDKLLNTTFPDFHKLFGIDFMGKGSYPKCDIESAADSIIIEAAVPGLAKEDITISFDKKERILSISAKSQVKGESKKQNYIHKELKKSSFARSWTLDNTLCSDAIKASAKNGILTIKIPKKANQPMPKKEDKLNIKID